MRGLLLLNATPFWSFKPPASRPQGIWGAAVLNATVPVAQGLKQAIEVMWWNRLRNAATVRCLMACSVALELFLLAEPTHSCCS